MTNARNKLPPLSLRNRISFGNAVICLFQVDNEIERGHPPDKTPSRIAFIARHDRHEGLWMQFMNGILYYMEDLCRGEDEACVMPFLHLLLIIWNLFRVGFLFPCDFAFILWVGRCRHRRCLFQYMCVRMWWLRRRYDSSTVIVMIACYTDCLRLLLFIDIEKIRYFSM